MDCCACFTKSGLKNVNSNSVNETKSIEKQMKLAQVKDQKTIRVLLLGPGNSGKTTILKQIRKIHCLDDKTELNERQKITKYVQHAVIEYTKILCEQSEELHDKHKLNTLVHSDNEHIRQEMLQLDLPCALTQQIMYKIKILWSDPGIQPTLESRSLYQIHENVSYFLDQLDTIASPTYTPSFEDYLRFRQRSTGFTQTTMAIHVGNSGEHVFEFTDVGGQRSERGKWMKVISEDINAVLYVLAISDYDLMLYEDNKTNRLKESIDLFRSIMTKGNFFKGKTVLLFFNKYDLFKTKIKKTPITVAFKDFPVKEMNPNNADDVIRFVAGKFLKVFQDEKIKLSAPLHILRTTALNTNNIEKIFSDITFDLVQQNLKNLDLM
eukprot:21271_1